MDATWAYALSFSAFLTTALWYILYGKKITRLEIMLPATVIFITLGVLSLKYINVLPANYVPWFTYPTVIMCLVGGMAMLTHISPPKP